LKIENATLRRRFTNFPVSGRSCFPCARVMASVTNADTSRGRMASSRVEPNHGTR
jgi:hypothetical protein